MSAAEETEAVSKFVQILLEVTDAVVEVDTRLRITKQAAQVFIMFIVVVFKLIYFIAITMVMGCHFWH